MPKAASIGRYSGGDNHVDYMASLVNVLRRNGVSPPPTNGKVPYAYEINRFWQKSRQVFLLGLPDRIILYGVPPATFERIDRLIDGQADTQKGSFTGKPSTDHATIIGQWII